mgnify:CR=1 FL=1
MTGTGKTSMALRFMVEEALCDPDASLLLTSYTNRAVDEICAMLTEADIDYLRIGNEYTCAASICSFCWPSLRCTVMLCWLIATIEPLKRMAPVGLGVSV